MLYGFWKVVKRDPEVLVEVVAGEMRLEKLREVPNAACTEGCFYDAVVREPDEHV